MKVALIFPPQGHFTQPYLSLPSLKAYLNQQGIEDVWQALTDIEVLKKWMVSEGEFVPQLGGKFELELKDGSSVSGRIDILLPPRRMRMVVALRPGEELLASGPTTVEFALRESDGKTRLMVTVAGIPATEEWAEDYRRSEIRWKNGLVELEELLRRR